MESSELNTPPPPPKNDHHAGKSTPPPPSRDTLTSSASSKSHHRRLRSGSGGGDDDDCSSISSAASSPSYTSRKPPKPEATQPPPNQEMERSTSDYRIPPSVFERNKSSSPADWSVASNESLFSIHVGNMSFTNDSYMWRSGELGPPTAAAAAPPPPEQMFCYSAHSSTGGTADMRSRELGIAEATMLEVIKENEGRSQPLTTEARQARRSAGSNQSNMSFAFSTAGGDTERMASSVKSSLPASQVQRMDSSEPQPDVQSPVAKEKGAQPRTKWLFCCPCFSFCP